MLSHRELFFRNLAQTSYAPLAIEIEKASGCWLYGRDGNKYFDLIAGVSVSNIGHNNPLVIQAVKDQVENHMHIMVYGELIQKPQVNLAEYLTGYLPGKLNSVYFTNSGSESVEGAIKLSRRYTGRYEIVTFKNAYHGSTIGALSVTGNEKIKRSFRPLMPSVKVVDYNSEDSLSAITFSSACVFIEPIQGEAGVVVPENGFLSKVRERCRQTGTLMVLDEIQTGFGRTGKMFAMDLYDVEPDIVLFAKGFGGGMPLGAFVSSREIMSSLSDDPALGHITTFGGHPVSCAAGLASLKLIADNKLDVNAHNNGLLFRKYLVHPRIKDVRGEGLLIAVELDSAAHVKKMISYALEKGVLSDWFLFNENCIRISPPLIITTKETEYVCGVLLDSMDKL